MGGFPAQLGWFRNLVAGNFGRLGVAGFWGGSNFFVQFFGLELIFAVLASMCFCRGRGYLVITYHGKVGKIPKKVL